MPAKKPSPNVDKSRSDHRNIPGVVMSVKDQFY